MKPSDRIKQSAKQKDGRGKPDIVDVVSAILDYLDEEKGVKLSSNSKVKKDEEYVLSCSSCGTFFALEYEESFCSICYHNTGIERKLMKRTLEEARNLSIEKQQSRIKMKLKNSKECEHEIGRRAIGGLAGHQHIHPTGEQICLKCNKSFGEIMEDARNQTLNKTGKRNKNKLGG